MTPKLTPDEKALLKEEIHKAWDDFPTDMKKFIINVKKEKINAMYMIQNWAKEHDNQVMLDLITRRILHKEEKLQQMEESIKE